MLRLLADENFNGNIVRGLLRRRATLNLVRVQDVGLEGADDPHVLAWAGNEQRIVLTHDRATMATFAYERIESQEPMPGVFILNDRLSLRQAIDELLFVDKYSEYEEWNNLVVYLPL